MTDVILSVSDFVGVLNQTLENAYPNVVIVGELANFKVSKNRWVYFDLKDEYASVRFFGTVYQLPGPLEDGMMLQVRGNPRLHPQFGFSVTIVNLQPVGEGSLKKAAALLQAKLTAEGLFDDSRKRPLPYLPERVGLITSGESAAYADFVKIMNERWGGVDMQLADVQVQGEQAPAQIVRAIEYFNAHAQPPEVLIITRGGGSAEDLAAFSTEQVTRAVAASRIPTMVAIGHEVDLSLAELAADQRASTPSNAAQLLVPDKKQERTHLKAKAEQLGYLLQQPLVDGRQQVLANQDWLRKRLLQLFEQAEQDLASRRQLLQALSPQQVLRRGYAVVRREGKPVTTAKQLKPADKITIQFRDGDSAATIN
ncbi:MAG: Exodeoxyribonuclease 7 large subunit [Patescibacteria group bacterium]|nr:Exodeoxyribonuclease 7 large subunit [Patescibacteria group bacterium]